jgi:hypothetical protein
MWVIFLIIQIIDLVLIDQQSVEKRRLRLMDIVDEMDDHLLACQQVFEKVLHSDTLAKERASFLKVNDISFLGIVVVL